MKTLLAEMLAERLASIKEAISQLEQDDAETGLHNLGAHLPNLLVLIERDAGITAAADGLLSTATALVQGHNPAGSRMPGAAFSRFQARLKSARVRERGRMMGLA